MQYQENGKEKCSQCSKKRRNKKKEKKDMTEGKEK